MSVRGREQGSRDGEVWKWMFWRGGAIVKSLQPVKHVELRLEFLAEHVRVEKCGYCSAGGVACHKEGAAAP